jgi:phage gpG-like protein
MKVILAGDWGKNDERLSNALKAAQGDNLFQILLAGAKVILRYALIKAPVKTGFLRGTGQLGREGNSPIVGFATVYATIQEFGGWIKPVKAQMLAIPLPGVTGSPRDYDLHIQKYGGTVVTLADKLGHVMFILKNSVYIPAHPYLRPAIDEHVPEIEAQMMKVVERMVQ